MKPRLSFRYRLIERIVPFLCRRDIYRMNAGEFRAWLEREQGRRNTAAPAWIRRKYRVSLETVNGRPLYIIGPKKPAEKPLALLFLHGGGFIFEAHWIHWRAVAKIIDALGITVWFPAYPLLSGPPLEGRHPAIRDINEMIRSVYDRMPGGNIVFLGDSAGASLALSFCHHNRALGLPLPCKLILVSPAMIAGTSPDVLEEMRAVDRSGKDVMLSLGLMDVLTELLQMDGNPQNYFHSPLLGDFTGFPPMEVFSGDCEIFYPQISHFAGTSGAVLNFYTGPGMMHVWPYMPLAPECKAALKKIITLIAGE